MLENDALHAELTEQIIGGAYRVANTLGVGFLEKVYENALAHELAKSGLLVEQQKPIDVWYDGLVVGIYVADLLVAGSVIVEIKSVAGLDTPHVAQALNYLKATGLSLALLINFGTARIGIKRVINSPKPGSSS